MINARDEIQEALYTACSRSKTSIHSINLYLLPPCSLGEYVESHKADIFKELTLEDGTVLWHFSLEEGHTLQEREAFIEKILGGITYSSEERHLWGIIYLKDGSIIISKDDLYPHIGWWHIKNEKSLISNDSLTGVTPSDEPNTDRIWIAKEGSWNERTEQDHEN